MCAVAKRDLKAGETLDDYGCYMTYGEAVNSPEMRQNRYLPEGLVEGCVLLKDIPKDQVLTYDDVTLASGPPGGPTSRRAVSAFRGPGVRLGNVGALLAQSSFPRESASVFVSQPDCCSAPELFPFLSDFSLLAEGRLGVLRVRSLTRTRISPTGRK